MKLVYKLAIGIGVLGAAATGVAVPIIISSNTVNFSAAFAGTIIKNSSTKGLKLHNSINEILEGYVEIRESSNYFQIKETITTTGTNNNLVVEINIYTVNKTTYTVSEVYHNNSKISDEKLSEVKDIFIQPIERFITTFDPDGVIGNIEKINTKSKMTLEESGFVGSILDKNNLIDSYSIELDDISVLDDALGADWMFGSAKATSKGLEISFYNKNTPSEIETAIMPVVWYIPPNIDNIESAINSFTEVTSSFTSDNAIDEGETDQIAGITELYKLTHMDEAVIEEAFDDDEWVFEKIIPTSLGLEFVFYPTNDTEDIRTMLLSVTWRQPETPAAVIEAIQKLPELVSEYSYSDTTSVAPPTTIQEIGESYKLDNYNALELERIFGTDWKMLSAKPNASGGIDIAFEKTDAPGSTAGTAIMPVAWANFEWIYNNVSFDTETEAKIYLEESMIESTIVTNPKITVVAGATLEDGGSVYNYHDEAVFSVTANPSLGADATDETVLINGMIIRKVTSEPAMALPVYEEFEFFDTERIIGTDTLPSGFYNKLDVEDLNNKEIFGIVYQFDLDQGVYYDKDTLNLGVNVQGWYTETDITDGNEYTPHRISTEEWAKAGNTNVDGTGVFTTLQVDSEGYGGKFVYKLPITDSSTFNTKDEIITHGRTNLLFDYDLIIKQEK